MMVSCRSCSRQTEKSLHDTTRILDAGKREAIGNAPGTRTVWGAFTCVFLSEFLEILRGDWDFF